MNYAEVHNEKGLVYLVLVLVGVSFLVFLLLYMTPGDPVRMMLGESATPEAQTELRLELGLDDPFLVQYGRYIKISWYIRIWTILLYQKTCPG